MFSKIVLVVLMMAVITVAVSGKNVCYGEKDMEFSKPDNLCLEVLEAVDVTD